VLVVFDEGRYKITEYQTPCDNGMKEKERVKMRSRCFVGGVQSSINWQRKRVNLLVLAFCGYNNGGDECMAIHT
jgi:hypothetical protein